MKKLIILLLVLALGALTACTPNMETTKDMRIKPVKLTVIKEETKEVYLNYIGVIHSGETRKIGFKSPGKIEHIFVKEGDQVKKGSAIAKLDTKDLELMVAASKAQMNAAKAEYDKALKGATKADITNASLNMKKAKDAYDYAQENYDKLEKLYKEGAVSKKDFDQVKLELDLRESEYSQATQVYNQIKDGTREEDQRAAQSIWEQAKSDYEYRKNLLEDGLLQSDVDGYVMSILYKIGEFVPQGYPLVVIRNESQVIKVGLSQEDVYKVKVGSQGIIDLNGLSSIGRIISISETPDYQSRTYEAEITLDKNQFKIGSLAKVRIPIGKEKGIWIPIAAIMTDGEDYIYVSEDNVIKKKKIELGDIDEDQVKVEGLANGDKLVVENIKQIRQGDLITVVD